MTYLKGRGIARFLPGWALLAIGLALLAVQAGYTEDKKAEAVTPLRFVVYGDTRDGHAVHRKLVALILKANPDLILQTGDLVHRGSDDALWKTYDDITGEMRKKIPVYPVRGNHDFGGDGYAERMTAPFTSGNKDYYAFDKANCHFIALDVDEHAPYGPSSDQYKWLVKDLAQAQKAAKHIFVYFHVPPYSIGSHGSDLEVRKTLCPVFEKYGVRIVFNGHDHNYYRTRRNQVEYIVSGGGGAPLYPTYPEKGVIEGDKWESVHHILLCEVKGNDIEMTAIRLDGSVIDHFTVSGP